MCAVCAPTQPNRGRSGQPSPNTEGDALRFQDEGCGPCTTCTVRGHFTPLAIEGQGVAGSDPVTPTKRPGREPWAPVQGSVVPRSRRLNLASGLGRRRGAPVAAALRSHDACGRSSASAVDRSHVRSGRQDSGRGALRAQRPLDTGEGAHETRRSRPQPPSCLRVTRRRGLVAGGSWDHGCAPANTS